jgi:AAA+ ATPase superfamily predicted ATPase
VNDHPFINRDRELVFLENVWNQTGPQLIILWGKRRVGKTELVRQFTREKSHIYFLGESTSETQQIRRFSETLATFFKDPLLETRGFAGWEEAFRYLSAKKEKILLVIDEFPYLIESNRAIPSLFQKAWDEHLSKSPIHLVLLGSSIAMMEQDVLSLRSPLFGRRTGQWRVDPLSYASAGLFRRGKSYEDHLSHYAVAGGVPAYWLQFDERADFWKNVDLHVLSKGQPLYEEVEFILREELREPRYYFALLQAIAQGKRKLAEIVNATGIPQASANKYLGVLGDLKIIEREVPITEKTPAKSKRGYYRIMDEFFRFWFKYVFPNRAELELGNTEAVLNRIRTTWPDHLGTVYEIVAREMLWEYRESVFPFSAAGRWWNKEEEIDVVALSPELDTVLFGEAKWSEKPVGVDILEKLQDKAKKVAWGTPERKEIYALFNKAGFTNAVMNRAASGELLLFKQGSMLGQGK